MPSAANTTKTCNTKLQDQLQLLTIKHPHLHVYLLSTYGISISIVNERCSHDNVLYLKETNKLTPS